MARKFCPVISFPTSSDGIHEIFGNTIFDIDGTHPEVNALTQHFHSLGSIHRIGQTNQSASVASLPALVWPHLRLPPNFCLRIISPYDWCGRKTGSHT